MEKYYRVSDVNEILNKLAKEPTYYHEGEGFYNGVCAVEGELMCLEPVETVAPVIEGTWSNYSSTMMECSECKKHVPYHRYEFCPHCGAKMLKE